MSWPVFQDNLGKMLPEMYNQSGFEIRQAMMGVWGCSSIRPYANNLHVA